MKGFDGVHLVPSGDSFELWLGEAKFFKNPNEAIKEAVTSIRSHIIPAFLTAEKAMILGHISSSIPLYDKVLPIFKSQTSSDKLLQLAVFPVLIAYESEAVSAHKQVCDQYIEQLRTEIYDLRQFFAGRATDLNLRFRLIFVPMKSKEAVIKRFDQKLEAFL